MTSAIDFINAAYLALALFIGVASVVALFKYSKDSRTKTDEKIYADNSTNAVRTEISGLRKEARMSIWLIFCMNLGISFLIFKGLH